MPRSLLSGKPPNPKREEILALLRAGLGPSEIGRQLGVTKNVVVGLKARAGLCIEAPVPTLFDRMDALHRTMDALLAEAGSVHKARGFLAHHKK